MGILNYTPDSFSDGGKYNTPRKALEHLAQMISEGADIIDLGCNSTRPGAEIRTAEDELARIREILPLILRETDKPVSVDTFYPLCAEYCLEKGAAVINDVSGAFNTETAELVKKYGAGYVVTHNPGGADMQAEYPQGVLSHVEAFFEECSGKAGQIGFSEENLCFDPGFGFGKSADDNYALLADLDRLTAGRTVLAGVSRKRFVSRDNSDRDSATCAANARAIIAGADIIRVHDVRAAYAVRSVAESIMKNRLKGESPFGKA